MTTLIPTRFIHVAVLVGGAIDDRSRLNADVCPDVKSVPSSFNVILIPFSLALESEIHSMSRPSIPKTSSASALSLPVRIWKRVTRTCRVTASSGSREREDNFL